MVSVNGAAAGVGDMQAMVVTRAGAADCRQSRRWQALTRSKVIQHAAASI